MLHATPFAAIDELQIMEPLVQGIAERTIEIAIENRAAGHISSLLKILPQLQDIEDPIINSILLFSSIP
jgi:hypothetical protein